MAPPLNLYTLNAPQDTFWDFIANLNEPTGQQNQAPGQTQETARDGPSSEKSADKQPTVEDEQPNEQPGEPSQEKGKAPDSGANPPLPHRQRGCHNDDGAARSEHPCQGRREGRRGFGYHRGPFMGGPPGGFPFAPPEGPPRHGCRGRGPPPPGPPPHFAPHAHPWGGPWGGPRGPHGRPNFDLKEFLSNLGSRLGLDLSGAAENLGLNDLLNKGPSLPDGIDFEPRTDIFDTPAAYILHLSLAGAKKSDLGVDWDGENSTIRIGGVVYRPNLDEETFSHLVLEGRKAEVGVFEKKVRLGTRQQPAHIKVAAITAKMVDGVLVVTAPKTEPTFHRREVPIGGTSGSPSPVRDEKAGQVAREPLIDLTKADQHQAAEMEVDQDARSPTEAGDAEKLPRYREEDQNEESEEEGDYVKIDVK